MTREEHMAWCKQRALAYLPDDPMQALTSMMSDLDTHPETRSHTGHKLTIALMMLGKLRTPAEARKHIEGFN